MALSYIYGVGPGPLQQEVMNRNLVKTNLAISLILLLGFGVAAWLGNRTNYGNSIESLEQVTALTADSIYFQLSQLLNKPVNVAQTMAHDTLLITHLKHEGRHRDGQEYEDAIGAYLSAYQQEDDFDSVFLVDTETGRYYTGHGLDRTIVRHNPDDAWYYKFLETGKEYELNIDNNKERGAGRAITVFINARVVDGSGKVVGVIGIGIKVEYLKDVINKYEAGYGVEVYFINSKGRIEVSSQHTGEQGENFFRLFGIEGQARTILERKNQDANYGFWIDLPGDGAHSSYVVTRYMPNLDWYALISHNTAKIVSGLKSQLLVSLIVLGLIMVAVVGIISLLMKKFNSNIAEIIDQRHELFKRATEALYEDILEWNIDNNSLVDTHTKAYLKKLGASNPTYDESISLIAERQVAPESRAGYLATFNRENIREKFRQGATNLRYDLRATRDGENYHWLRIDAHVFYSPEDAALHMFTYRRNIDAEKRQEMRANTDEMTGCYSKKATERAISEELMKHPDGMKAFFILDIDNFKRANDDFGHAFGDLCIRSFAAVIKSHFREHDIVGRLGGDEFAVFVTLPNLPWIRERARELSRALNFVCQDGESRWQVSASIGISIYPENGATFEELYRKADEALYRIKQAGKNGVAFASADAEKD